MIWLSLILFAIALLLMPNDRKKNVDHYFQLEEAESESFDAINIKELTAKKGWQKTMETVSGNISILGPRSVFYVAMFSIGSLFGSWYLFNRVFTFNNPWLVVISTLGLLFVGYRYLKDRRRKEFEKSFPDALNIMMSAVTAGDSLMQAITYVGDTMGNSIGRDFKYMGNRLKMGETPEVVLQRACKIYPYPEFVFFTLTLKANISRGGQLKGVLAKLIRVLVDSRTMEKKKLAMTSEARMSAKIVALIPVGFCVLLSSISPDKLDFILYDPDGRGILYYVVGSELLGLAVIWLLMKGVR
ncbi:type II secretion system F family protein [Vibrio maritimus]|uniref:type II secretion system F family protein n=1 Tax=Vibrio maritimus TaxID=990268 RepID=UPI001F24449E|nr:type II secretion system F family protein [Vibrio maritimus]